MARKRLLLIGCMCLTLLASTVSAQIVNPSPQIIGSGSSGACTTGTGGNCATWNIQAVPTLTLQLTGTMTSMTVTFEGTTDGQTWFSILATKLSTGVFATTTTSTGQYAVANTGLVGFRARCTTYVSGSINAFLTRGVAASAVKLFDLSNVTGTLAAANGGTGISSYAIGDMLYASAATTLSKLTAVASGSVLASAGVTTAPAWTTAPTVTGAVQSNFPSTGTSTTANFGLRATASTAAALGAQQDSPWIEIAGNGWNSTSNASHVANFVWRVRPVQGNPVTSNLTLLQSINSENTPGGYSTIGTWTNTGNYTNEGFVGADGFTQNGRVMVSATAPTISSGFGTNPSIVTSNGTAAFTINVGTGGTAQTGVIGLPTATTGWSVYCADVTTQSSTVFVTKQTASATTSATIGLFDAAGAAAAWTASDILVCQATGY